MKSKTRQILLNVIGSIVFLSLPILFSPDLTNPEGFLHVKGFQRDFIGYVLLFLFFYLNYLVLLPELFFKKKYLLFTLCILISFAIVIFLPDWNLGNKKAINFPANHSVSHHFPRPSYARNFFIPDLKARFIGFLLVLTFSFLLKMSMRLKQTEKEKLNAELSYLKAQINPHFLFNTLNSIYSLAINKSDETPAAIVKLSSMMRYVISESNQHFVPLEKEINYLSSYIELQKLRLENTVDIKFALTGSPEGKHIAPLILIPFVENAFKHGVNPEENSRIEISMMINFQGIQLHIYNNKVNSLHDNDQRVGLGMENATARLQLLYPGRHLLTVDDSEKYFSVDLTMNMI